MRVRFKEKRTKYNSAFPFLPGDRVLICPGDNFENHVLFPIHVTDEDVTYTFEEYELGKEGLTLYIREGQWQYNFASLSNGYYSFIGSHMNDRDLDDPFRPHLH